MALSVASSRRLCVLIMTDTEQDDQTAQPEVGCGISENTVEYLLFIIDGKSDARQTFSVLERIRKETLDLCRDLTKEYIWQRDEFNLQLKNEGGEQYSNANSN